MNVIRKKNEIHPEIIIIQFQRLIQLIRQQQKSEIYIDQTKIRDAALYHDTIFSPARPVLLNARNYA